jgi:hypothetical protein
MLADGGLPDGRASFYQICLNWLTTGCKKQADDYNATHTTQQPESQPGAPRNILIHINALVCVRVILS